LVVLLNIQTYYIFYQAVESAIFEDRENGIEILLQNAREKNKRLDITGMLLHIEGSFIQYIEGEEVSVKELFKAIEKDSRLAAIKVIDSGNAKNRIFINWEMAYENFNINTINHIEKIDYPNIQEYLKSASTIKLIKLMIQRKAIFEGIDRT
jgi:hypothetical protein